MEVEEPRVTTHRIDAAPTSTLGMAGLTPHGPVSEAQLVTSFAEFEQTFGGPASAGGVSGDLAHAARGFFANGGRRLYVARVVPGAASGDSKGGDGVPLTAADLAGGEPYDNGSPATGLRALERVDEISIVALPDAARLPDDAEYLAAVSALIGHCERQRDRVAIVDAPQGRTVAEVRGLRAQLDSSFAALYHPWVEVTAPTASEEPPAPAPVVAVPASGFVAGVYARNDLERGVHKAPANLALLGIVGLAAADPSDPSDPSDHTIEPQADGVNTLRTFPDGTHRVWGARTMSSDPEWKYVNVRRLLIHLEHSIDRSTQWAVFEPNGEALWSSIRDAVDAFLLATWRSGALAGTKPEQAWFVRCDRTTMTQDDLDTGRLICLIGVAPVRPAEFVLLRIGLWTADARRP